MASLFKNRGIGKSKGEVSSSRSPVADLPSPFGELGCDLSDSELRETAYEIFIGACRPSGGKPTGGKPMIHASQSDKGIAEKMERSVSISQQRSLSSTAASKMKKALGLKSLKKSPGKESGSPGSKRPVTVGELMRVQMKISEQSDSRIRRALLRISAGMHGKRFEQMVLPLELLQQFKASDFLDQEEYEGWQIRNLKVIEAGLLLHPHLPVENSDPSAQRLRQIIHGAFERPLETGRNSESMQVLRSAVMSLACKSSDGSAFDTYHWADGYPLNLQLYQMLLEACFDNNEETSIIEEVDEFMELIKKTWPILGLNQMLHNLCFSWILFHRFVATGQVENSLLFAADNQLVEVAKDAKATKDPMYAKILSSTLSSILGWADKRLLAYHDTFHSGNIDSMHSIVSLGVSSAMILAEDISREYRRRRKEEVDVARKTIDIYIKSSLRTAFAQRMEKADSSRRASKNQPNPLPILSILAKDINDLAKKEKEVFSPILKRWHPLAAGVAVATLHACYGNELKQFTSGVMELTPDVVQVLKAADKLEKDLVQIAVEDSVDSDDGGKAIIREMPPYEAESKVANLAKEWIRIMVDRLKEWIDRNLQHEVWNPRANKESIASSAVEVIRIADETLDAFFQLPIPMHSALLPDLMIGLNRNLQQYISKAKFGCGTRKTYVPTLPALTRCSTSSKLWIKKEKSQNSQKRKSQVGTVGSDDSFGLPQLCVRMNTLYHLRTELESLEKRIVTYLRNAESCNEDIASGVENKFELSIAACQEGIQQLCEATAYKVVFHDLSNVLWDNLYIGDVASSRIEPFQKGLDTNLDIISSIVHDRVRNHVITAVMKASFDGFLLVLLAGGPSRAFTLEDCRIIEDDFVALKDLYVCNGDGLPEELVDKASTQLRSILPLFRTETDGLVERYRRLTIESYGPSAKSKLPLPPTSGNWSPTEPNTILRVLCYRNDKAASKFLNKAYRLPTKL